MHRKTVEIIVAAAKGRKVSTKIRKYDAASAIVATSSVYNPIINSGKHTQTKVKISAMISVNPRLTLKLLLTSGLFS